MIENTILKRNRQGLKGRVFAMPFPSTELVELAARAGFDAVSLDGEHGVFTTASVDLICRVANGYGMSVIARVPNIDAHLINLWLDRGIQGILGPHIENGAEAQRLADACLFPPDGHRSWGGWRGTEFNEDTFLNEKFGGKLGYMQWANANMIVSAQVESKTSFANLDAILAVRGLSSIAGGPNDFAASLGHPGQPDHPERQRLTAEADAMARRAGKPPMGDTMVTLGIQELLLATGRDFVKKNADTAIGG